MSITRHFLGLKRPALASAAEWLLDRRGMGETADLSKAIVVVPGRNAARRLIEILLLKAQQRSVTLLPPKVETVGSLPEHLYEPKFPFASSLVQQLAWTRALRSCDAETLARIVPRPPSEEDDAGWLAIGEMLRVHHTELAADGMDFHHVAEAGRNFEEFVEAERWMALFKVQQAYHSLLDSLNLWDKQSARLYAIEHREFHAQEDTEIILIGATDLNRAMRLMLDQVADRVVSLIFAPPDWADRFDDHGCVDPRVWQQATIDLRDDQLFQADSPADQAEEVSRQLAALDGRYRADEVTIGLPDQGLASQVQRQLQQCDVASRWFQGKRLLDTGPCRLLGALANYLERRRYSDFAALIRHPDLFDWLARAIKSPVGQLLKMLDEHYCNHLPAQLDVDLIARQGDGYGPLLEAIRAVEKLVSPLQRRDRPIAQWAAPIGQVLLKVYGWRDWDRDIWNERTTVAACERLQDTLMEHRTLPEELAPVVSAASAIRLTLDQLASQQIPPPREAEAVDLYGWLELPWDDAPALVVASFNEGFVPTSATADMFLPDSFRRRLGLLDNERRYARDAYALSVLLASREHVSLIVGRHDSLGNPLTPSRLLFAADGATVARRAMRFFATPSSDQRAIPMPSGERKESSFVVPRPRPLEMPIQSMRVTDFRLYLSCPYRYYLARGLKLKEYHDHPQELEPAAFGTLLHDVLEEFGKDESIRDSQNARDIENALHDKLDRYVAEHFGDAHIASVDIQAQQARRRLTGFAQWQARHRAAGWRILYVETNEFKQQPALMVDGDPMLIAGRIDRVDIHDDQGVMVLDYKTGDSGSDPNKVHRWQGEWVDLQLPLYRQMATFLKGVDGPIAMGYVLLPKDTSKSGLSQAAWSKAELAQAEETAHTVVRSVRGEKFWPPVEPAPRIGKEFGPICQDRLLSKRFE